ncbi:MAG: hypothetical protein GF334_03805 [Candidatus Altiarchaeales archaeon]|nr:hypothetical protein [Candidatus Altiarchaeales archaeon]
MSQINLNGSIAFIVGGAQDNRVTEYLMVNNLTTSSRRVLGGLFNLTSAQTQAKVNVLILDHPRAAKALEYKAAEDSILKHWIPQAYIPLVASGLGILLMTIITILKTSAEFKALEVGRRTREHYSGFKIFGVPPVEVAALLGAATVLGSSLTYTFHKLDFELTTLLLNIGLCLFAALSHELGHRVVGRVFGIHIEYHFWLSGSLVTLATATLGNSFGIQGFLMERIEGDIENWKYGLTKLAAPVLSCFIMVFLGWLNMNNPTRIYQMIYSTAGLWAIAEILPLKALDGYDIKKWSGWVWKISFTVIATAYVAVHFIL